MRKRLSRFGIVAIVLLVSAGCYNAPRDEEEETDTSTNTDTSSDTSSESESESETESDPGADNSDPDCPACYWNTQFPCGCNFITTEGECDDGSMCASVSADFVYGACMAPCETSKDCEALATEWEGCGGTPSCAFVSSESDSRFCGYLCDSADDCPPGMYCDHTFEELSFCIGVGNI